MSLDNETARQLTEGEHVHNMLKSEGWVIVKAKLDERILDLQNISNLDMTSENTLLFDIKARKMAAQLLFDWLQKDVIGFAEQQAAAQEAMRESRDDSFIDRKSA